MGSRNPERYTDRPDWTTHRTAWPDEGRRLASGDLVHEVRRLRPADIDHLIEVARVGRLAMGSLRHLRPPELSRAPIFKAPTGPADLCSG